MNGKRFTVKEKVRKIEKKKKAKPKIGQVSKSAFKTNGDFAENVELPIGNIYSPLNKERPFSNLEISTPTCFNFPNNLNVFQLEYDQVFNTDPKEPENGKADEASEINLVTVFQQQNSSVQTDLNFPFTSDVMEDEGMELIFHKQYQRVQKLDSPQMSISSTQQKNGLPLIRFQNDLKFEFEPFAAENPGMFGKMQQLCRENVAKKIKFGLIPTFRKDGEKSFEGSLVFEAEQNSKRKSSSRKSKKTSRKNSSLENFNLA